MRKNKKQKRQQSFFQQNNQQKAFGEWTNLLDPPVTFAEILARVIITPESPDGFLKELEPYSLSAEVRITK